MIPLAEPDLDGNELAYVSDCIQRGWISSRGDYLPRFEGSVAAWCGVRHAIATSSGTAALHLALLALGLGPGDEVIVPALTYVASANAVIYTGARPVFVDTDPHTWNIDLNQLEDKINSHTRAIIAVHLYAHPVDMTVVWEIAQKYGLWIVEDACQAQGSEYRGQRTGGLGHIGCYSTFGSKLISTGEGGMVLTDSDDLATAVRSLGDQARGGNSYWHTQVAYNYRMTNMQAAIGSAQMERVEQFIRARERVADTYDRLLANTPGLRLYANPAWSRSVCWLYSLLIEAPYGLTRDELITHLAGNGIESKPFFTPMPRLPAYQDREPYPVADRLSSCGISLPTSVKLTTEQIEHIAHVIHQAGS